MAKEMANMNPQGDVLEEKLVQVNRVAKVVKGGRVLASLLLLLLGMVKARLALEEVKLKKFQ